MGVHVSTALRYRSYAKLNLYLDVIDKRSDGYHNIETIFQSVSLYDELAFIEQPNRVTLTCNLHDFVPSEENLAYRAAMLLKDLTGCSQGAHIQLTKNIPVAAGLAGGSGNAAAALVALNTLWDLRLAPGVILSLALKLGSDVPYCTRGGAVAARRRGEEMMALPPLPKAWFVLVHPEIAVSAARVYNSPLLEYSAEKPFAGWTRSFRKAAHAFEKGNFAGSVFNRMERPVFDSLPQLAEAKQRLLSLGCVAAAMSGSGPTLFGVCMNKREATGVSESIKEFRTSVVHTTSAGLERVG